MDYVLALHREYDDYGVDVAEDLTTLDGNCVFEVRNLDGCPEDAVIGRDLFNANSYIRTLNKGIELAKQGYDKVVVIDTADEEEENE